MVQHLNCSNSISSEHTNFFYNFVYVHNKFLQEDSNLSAINSANHASFLHATTNEALWQAGLALALVSNFYGPLIQRLTLDTRLSGLVEVHSGAPNKNEP